MRWSVDQWTERLWRLKFQPHLPFPKLPFAYGPHLSPLCPEVVLCPSGADSLPPPRCFSLLPPSSSASHLCLLLLLALCPSGTKKSLLWWELGLDVSCAYSGPFQVYLLLTSLLLSAQLRNVQSKDLHRAGLLGVRDLLSQFPLELPSSTVICLPNQSFLNSHGQGFCGGSSII